ncbi:capsule biosynthesis protein [Halodurantibacterium flavum]|uniref:Capsule biosynthesis protein n=1 Tax=Halodurantibacterium flavum TaxID=1382802 RepID=A0ABW4S316_9RHOB
MTIKPRAKRFRTGRTGAEGNQAAPGTGAADAAAQDASEREAELAAIRAEGLTDRQLARAMQLAEKEGLSPASDIDAVRLLRARGIDPFHRDQALKVVASAEKKGAPAQKADEKQAEAQKPPQPRRNRRNDAAEEDFLAAGPGTDVLRLDGDRLPQKFAPPSPPGRPSAPSAEDERARQILQIQRDIARRRRRRMVLLVAQLFFFVLIPTIIGGFYYFRVATPLYATNTEMVIQQADGASHSALGGLFSGSGLATSQDSVTVQGYLQSREAMMRLDQELGFREHFSAESIDPIHRLAPDATNESAYRLYRRMVRIGYDPTEGVIKMEVIAADPAMARDFSLALIRYAEEQVDQLTQRLREDQMSGAIASHEDAEARMLEAQQRVVELQQSYEVLSSDMEVGLLTTQLSNLETQLTQDRLALQELLANPNPNRARVDPLERRIASLESEIATVRSRLTRDGSEGGLSLARIQSELVVAQSNVQTRQMMLAQSLQQLETARIEANRQVRYLSLGVSPVAPDEATYPRAVENTALVFLIFGGIFLMLTLTAAVLREQVSA